MIVSLGRRGLLEWRAGLALGTFLTVLYFVMTMNQWPLDRAGYDTNTPYSSFFLSQIGQAALHQRRQRAAGGPRRRAGRTSVSHLAARQNQAGSRIPPARDSHQGIFPRQRDRHLPGRRAHRLRHCVLHRQQKTRRLGAAGPELRKRVSTSLPWVYPLTIGIYAATSEEFLFRLFAIPFLLRITKSRFLAVVLPAFAWGFLHSNYPQEPAYIRGIEVGLIGIVAGLVMLRWGIWATLTWHYTVDAFLISTSLLRSHGAYLRISGAIVGGAALIPLAIAAISYISRGGFAADRALSQ